MGGLVDENYCIWNGTVLSEQEIFATEKGRNSGFCEQ